MRELPARKRAKTANKENFILKEKACRVPAAGPFFCGKRDA